jgi:major intracellular serine protease
MRVVNRLSFLFYQRRKIKMADYSQSSIHNKEIITQAYPAGFPFAWKNNRGDGIVIAILSSGIRSHFDLNDQILDGKNFTTDNGGVTTNYTDGTTTGDGSGTQLASIICGKQTTNLDGTMGPVVAGVELDKMGVAPNSKIIVGKTKLNNWTQPVENVIAGIQWATNWVGPQGEKVDIIFITYRSATENLALKTAIDEATAAGIFVTGSDNDNGGAANSDIYPNIYDNVIGIGPYRDDDWNYLGKNNTKIDFSAPLSSTAISYVNSTYPNIWYPNITNLRAELGAAVGVGALALILQAYKEISVPLTTVAQLRTELPKYCLTVNNLPGAGALDFNKTALPNAPQEAGTIVYVPVEPEPIEPNMTAPVVTTGSVTHNSVELSWDYVPAERDDVTYEIKRDGAFLIEIKSPNTFTDYEVNASTSYNYTVSVINDSGFVVESNQVPAITAEAPVVPTEPEPVVSNATAPVLTKGTVTYNSVALSWTYTPATNDDVYYQVKRNGVVVGEKITSKSFTDREVNASTNYNYTVAVYSLTNDIVVATSNQITAITAEAPPPETVTKYVDVPGETVYKDKIVYVNGGSGSGGSLTLAVSDGVVKADYGRRSANTRRYSN